jgi:Rrf2 family transcriptional regulator, iron-sulfur cluster assembly transcription factor
MLLICVCCLRAKPPLTVVLCMKAAIGRKYLKFSNLSMGSLVAFGRLLFKSFFPMTKVKKAVVMLKSINKLIEITINTLIDNTAYSRFGVPVRAIGIAKEQYLSLSRMEALLSTLKSVYLMRATKGRGRGDLLAVNHTGPRKISMNNLATEMIDSFENYLSDCLAKTNATSSVKDPKTQVSRIQPLPAWGVQKHHLQEILEMKNWYKKNDLITGVGMQKVEKLGPNFIFNLSNYF